MGLVDESLAGDNRTVWTFFLPNHVRVTLRKQRGRERRADHFDPDVVQTDSVCTESDVVKGGGRRLQKRCGCFRTVAPATTMEAADLPRLFLLGHRHAAGSSDVLIPVRNVRKYLDAAGHAV
jgi:hypothetical protein